MASGDTPTARASVLADEQLDHAFARDGFAVVDVLDPAAVHRLRAEHQRRVPQLHTDDGMALDYTQQDRAAMEAVTALLDPIWVERLPTIFADHRVIFSTFILKRAIDESGVALHDDRSFVDEREHRSFALWMALDDTSPEIGNGCLYVVPGSQQISTAASGSGTPDWITPYRGYLRRFLLPVPLRAGQAVVYDTKTLHCSPPNRTEHGRWALAAAIAPNSAPLRWTVAEGERRSVYAVDERFFVEVHPHEVERSGMPEGYELVDEYVESAAHPDPERIAAACDPSVVPVPEEDPPHLFPEPEPEQEPEVAPTASPTIGRGARLRRLVRRR